MSAAEWPSVPCDEYGQMLCPIILCDELLHLVREYAIPLIAEQDASGDHDPAAAVGDSWRVECLVGHVLHASTDQARHDGGDETSADAPEYDHWLTHHRVNRIGGDA